MCTPGTGSDCQRFPGEDTGLQLAGQGVLEGQEGETGFLVRGRQIQGDGSMRAHDIFRKSQRTLNVKPRSEDLTLRVTDIHRRILSKQSIQND